MDDAEFIIGLMRQGYNVEPNQLGFIPDSKIRDYYVPRGLYVIQYDLRGRRTGYILHGTLSPAGNVVITQAIIDYDRRGIGFGEMAFLTLVNRANRANCVSISLKIAEDLAAVTFFKAMGMQITNTIHRNNKRRRLIYQMYLALIPQLFDVFYLNPATAPGVTDKVEE